jgi:hypothetical protein
LPLVYRRVRLADAATSAGATLSDGCCVALGEASRLCDHYRYAWIGAVSLSLPVFKGARRYRPSVAVDAARVIGYDSARGPLVT